MPNSWLLLLCLLAPQQVASPAPAAPPPAAHQSAQVLPPSALPATLPAASSGAASAAGAALPTTAADGTPPAPVHAGAPRTAGVERINALLSRSELNGARVAVSVLDVEQSEALYARNVDTPMAPASNMKLLTTAAAVSLLRPDHVFRTRVLALAPPAADGRLEGDLVVLGSGDPCLRADAVPAGQPTDAAALLVDLLQRAGVQRIAGRLVLDDGLLDRTWVHPDWTPGDIANSYAAPVGALSIHGNCLRLAVEGGGDPGVSLATSAATYRVRNELRRADAPNEFAAGAFRPDAAGLVRVTGKVGKSVGRREIDVPVIDPAELFARCLLWHLDARGIKLSGSVAVEAGAAAALGPAVELACVETPLGNALVVANKESDNSIADHLFKVLGAAAGGEGSFEGGARAIAAFLEQRVGTSATGLVLRDGSGLSHRNRITARAMTSMLAVMARSETAVRDSFLRSLPVSGEDGSMDERLREAPYAGSVRAKTGYISGVSCLSGYARTRGGRTLAFSILINDYGPKQTNKQMKAIQDDLCRALVDLW